MPSLKLFSWFISGSFVFLPTLSLANQSPLPSPPNPNAVDLLPITILPIVPPQAQPEELPKTMVSLGDSITAGAVAGLSRSHFYNPLHVFKLLGTLGEIAVKWSAYGAIQDRHLSWSSGLDHNFTVQSHAHRLAYLHSKQGTKMKVGSVSWSGDSSIHLETQVTKALEWNSLNATNRGPDYVTLLIGANDICADDVAHMTDDRDFYNRVQLALSRLVEANPNTKIMISSLPDVNTLSSVAQRSWLTGIYPLQRCEDFWRKVNLCKTLTRLPAGSLDHHIVSEKVHTLNRILSEVASKSNGQSGAENIKFSSKTFETKFSDKDISIDCFHPNPSGQNKLAEVTWQDGFWAKNWSSLEYKTHVEKTLKERQKKRSKKLGPPHKR